MSRFPALLQFTKETVKLQNKIYWSSVSVQWYEFADLLLIDLTCTVSLATVLYTPDACRPTLCWSIWDTCVEPCTGRRNSPMRYERATCVHWFARTHALTHARTNICLRFGNCAMEIDISTTLVLQKNTNF